MTITPLPPAPDRTDPTTFSDRADAFVGALPPFVTQANALAVQVNDDAAAAAVSATEAEQASAAAVAVANVERWESGKTYAEGDAVYSPIDFLTYRRKSAGSSTTDPSLDAASWALVAGTGTVVLDAEQTFTANQTVDAEFKATSYNETFVAVTSTSNAVTVNCEAGNNFSHILTENTTFTFSNPPATGTAFGFTLKVVQDSTEIGRAHV